MAGKVGKAAQLSDSSETMDLVPPSGEVVHLPVKAGTRGPATVDVRNLYGAAGIFTFDPGYGSTASCESAITFIDGERGILLHRGYPIDVLAENCDFLEVCYLLLNGELPTQDEKEAFDRAVTEHTLVHAQIGHFFDGFKRDAHPMAMLGAVVGALAAFYPESMDIADVEQRRIDAVRLIAKMPTLAAMGYKYSIGQETVPPRNELGYAANFLQMSFANQAEKYEINEVLARALDRILILHADHGQNASTSTVRLAGSTRANPYSAISAGIAALSGPAHGGANEAVLRMLEEIGTTDRIGEYIARAKDRSDPFRLMGFGHRVYKSYDPRAKIMQKTCHEVLDELGLKSDPMLDLALELEKIALEDEFFVEKGLYPNVDFYSGITLRAIGFPTGMFSSLFAVGRTSGWIAQWKEMIEDETSRLGRPRQVYVGADQREFVPIDERVSSKSAG